MHTFCLAKAIALFCKRSSSFYLCLVFFIFLFSVDDVQRGRKCVITRYGKFTNLHSGDTPVKHIDWDHDILDKLHFTEGHIVQMSSRQTCLVSVFVFSISTFFTHTLKTLDESEVVKRLFLVCFGFCAKIVGHLVSNTHGFCVMDVKKGKLGFMDPFLIVREYSSVEYITNAYRMKWVSCFKREPV